MRFILLLSLLILGQTIHAQESRTGIWSRFEKEIVRETTFLNPFTETDLKVEFTRPDKSILSINGYFDHPGVWKFRIMPNMIGKWKYSAWFSDGSGKKVDGSFRCIASDIPGLITADETNPVWFGFKGGKHQLIRSFHAGDRFFADNWPDSERKQFLDWLVENEYNTLSVASHLLNRNAENRGKGWNTPDLWNSEKQQPNPAEYAKMEKILDELAARKIIVFPFAGFFGQKSNCPLDSTNQALYIKYTIARLGSYWNTMYSVAGPEPLYRNVKQFTKEQVDKLGEMIAGQNSQRHLLTVHNEKDQNPFVNSSWASYQCLQGPTTISTDTLYHGLMARRNLHQPVLAQEVLWYGNIYQQTYNDEQLRKNAFTIMMAGAALNFADNAGTSSTGFTGTLNISERHQDKHEIIKKVWDFFESIPYYELSPALKDTNNGYYLDRKGEPYLVYLPSGGNVSVYRNNVSYLGEWIKGSDTNIRISIGITNGKNLQAPSNEDWLLLLKRVNEKNAVNFNNPLFIGMGSYPDITADKNGILHITYVRDTSLMYRNYNPDTNTLGNEVFTSLTCLKDSFLGPNRSKPVIKVDSKGFIHVFVGQQYGYFDNNSWVKIDPNATRDTDMDIDQDGTVYIVKRGGSNGGSIGVNVRKPDGSKFQPTETDPDKGTTEGKNWLRKNGNHPYGNIRIDTKNTIHIVYRQALPEFVSYRQSTDGGKTWKGTGVFGGEQWQGETSDIGVTASGKVYVVSQIGEIYYLDKTTFKFSKLGKAITSENRELPTISTGNDNLMCVSSFGGKYSIYFGGKFTSEQKFPSYLNKPLGFLKTAITSNQIWGVSEEGEHIDIEIMKGSSSIFLKKLM
ncbi:MAG: DUF5060 domain-containing protein [Mariniphaga sp.]|nr:DUF5060 domain-containing protein [Mariniphaga sp.]